MNLQNVNTSLQSLISKNAIDISSINNSLGQFYQVATTNNSVLNSSIVGLNAQVTSQFAQITNNLNSLITLNNSFNSFTASALTNNTKQNTEITALNTSILNQQAQITSINSSLTQTKNDIYNQINELNRRISSIETSSLMQLKISYINNEHCNDLDVIMICTPEICGYMPTMTECITWTNGTL
ncbi:Hypothetical_protein [Hexamita inflata]|uniref:Hypothetical_protein n=1 Tax=Hexamita inflata TaxID=28002 RepID=A0AA86NLD2_9EUKA|nr:Hypothetical protein HINF_LOCUS8895 [Hexamita inflata]CAI9921255.1 Hypothetical protein HINF_LOCUS8900 [Hexamita inflata]